MFDNNIIKDMLIIVLVYIPPLAIYARFWREKDRSMLLLILISIVYLGTSIFTQNLGPFILVLLNIGFLKMTEEYNKYKFSLKEFKFFKGLKYSFYSYVITIFLASITLIVLEHFGIQQQKQDIVTWMADMDLVAFLITIPIAVVFAPVVEEFVFRWFFFEKLFRKRMGFLAGALLSSTIFAAIHYDIQAFPMILGIGIFNCYLIEKHGYWYAVFNHSVFNGVTVLALLLQKLGMAGI
ncbi:MAG: lysostaphin resistance A-like protein [Clostridiaceae bacterium]